MFAEINPADANDLGIKDGQWVWLEGPEGGKIKVKAMLTPRVGKGVVFTPYHFGGWFDGKSSFSSREHEAIDRQAVRIKPRHRRPALLHRPGLTG